MFEQLKSLGVRVKRDTEVYRRVVKDKRTPVAAKLILALAVGYLLLPFDIIPDFIPAIGHLDDLVIVPALVMIALKMIPEEVLEENRRLVEKESG